MNFKLVRTFFIVIWISITAIVLVNYFVHPESFTNKLTKYILSEYRNSVLLIYVIFSIIRGVFLLPSTIVVISGIILFPNQPFLVLFVSMLSIILTAVLIYQFSDFFKLGESIEKLYPQQKLRYKLNSKVGFIFVLLWSFFPFVPTDAICLAAGAVKMRLQKFLLALFIGEMLTCSMYILLGKELFDLIF